MTGVKTIILAAFAAAALPALSPTASGQERAGACPADAIAVAPGASIQDAVEKAGEGAAFCLRSGIHRAQVVRPKARQRFYGETGAILNGSRLLTAFAREGRYWVAEGQRQLGKKFGECKPEAPHCDLPSALFIDDVPLTRAADKASLQPGQFYLDTIRSRLFLVDDPAGRKVETGAAVFAFYNEVPGVLIKNLVVEKYAGGAQVAAIRTGSVGGWVIEDSEIRNNSGVGIAVGETATVRGSNVHHNGQLGIGGAGNRMLIENNRIWANNTRGFSSVWEAGGVKIVLSDGSVLRGNHVYENKGWGLWCDIECRNVLYENNVVERNDDAGIFHEISYGAVIRNNTLRHNGLAGHGWLWGSDILIAASEGVEVYGNEVTVRPDGCGVALIDQSRAFFKGKGKYKTRNNKVFDNRFTFDGAPCAGGASDVSPGDENYAIITEGNNAFDRNLYRVRQGAKEESFVWGHQEVDWAGFRKLGLEQSGQLVAY